MIVHRVLSLSLALLAGVACALLVACGGSTAKDLIPDDQASAMTSQLAKIDVAVRRGRCTGVDTAVAKLQSQVNDLSRKVNASLRAELQKGVQNLNDIAFDQCSTNAETTATTPTQTTTTTATQTVETQTTPTATTPTETTPTVTTPPETTTTPTVPPQTTPTTPPEGGATIPGDGTDTTGGAGGATPTP